MKRLFGVVSLVYIAVFASGCCGPTQFFRCGACIYDNCVVPTAQSPAFKPELEPDTPAPLQATHDLSMSY